MIYSEEILTEDDGGYAKLGRQKDSPEGKWYGLCLTYHNSSGEDETADNDEWIVVEGLPMFKAKQYKMLKEELNVTSKAYLKKIRKLMLEAEALGWFDEYK